MKSRYVKLNKFSFFLIGFIGLFIASISVFVLPERFFFDTKTYIYDPGNEIGLIGSYPLTIFFYDVTGLKHLHFSFIGIIQFIILFSLLYKIGIPKRFQMITIKNLIVYLGILMISIFISMPTKEFLNFIFIAGIVLLFKNKKFSIVKTVLLAIAFIIGFSYVFRQYYFFVAILPVLMYMVSGIQIKNKRLLTVSIAILCVIFISLSYGVIKGHFMSEIRFEVNEGRMNSGSANSMISPPIKPTTWYGETISILYGFFTVNFPVNGLLHLLSPQIIAFVVWQLLLITFFLIRFKDCLKTGRKNNYELWLFFMLFTFFIVQGVFEPDLGSAIRHKIGILPLIYYLLYYEDFRKELR